MFIKFKKVLLKVTLFFVTSIGLILIGKVTNFMFYDINLIPLSKGYIGEVLAHDPIAGLFMLSLLVGLTILFIKTNSYIDRM